VIAHDTDLAWVCPNCRHDGGRTVVDGQVVLRCYDCRFVFPSPLHDTHMTLLSPVSDDDDTWTEKWGPIRADRYRVIRALASGSQGRILLAHHRHLDQPCVIKIVASRDELWADVANTRLRNEAQAGVRVNHGNVARVLDCDCVDDCWYFVMEYIPGENLRRVLRDVHFLPWEQVLSIGRQVAAGLAAVHGGELIHRDVKPSNLMLAHDGTVKIMDLGLAKFPHRDGACGVTHAGQVVGTPLYMPPEQFDSDQVLDSRADVYAYGATMFHLLTGRPPFEGSGIEEIAHRHRHDPVVWTVDERERIPVWLREVVEGCLAKRREHRIATAGLIEESLVGHAAVSPVPVSIERSQALGVAVLSFTNLSRRAEDEWIGDAIAECLSSRLTAVDGLHVADRGALHDVMQRRSGSTGDQPGRSHLLEAARLVGVDLIIVGSVQRHNDDVRIIARGVSRTESESKQLGTVSGAVSLLFDLEDRLTEQIVSAIAPARTTEETDLGGGTKSLEAHEQYIRGQRAFADGDYEAAIAMAEAAQRIDPDYEEPVSLAGACHARMGKYERAIACHHRQECLARDHGHGVGVSTALSNLGAAYYYQGAYPIAYEFLDRAAQMSRESDPTRDTAKLFGNLGMVLMRLDRYEEAERAFQRAIDIGTAFNDLVCLVWPYNGMGSVLLKLERLTEAREYHQRALRLAEEVGDRVMVGMSQMNLGRCSCLMTDYSESEIWFNTALGTLERTSFWNGLTLVYEHLAEMHLLAGEPESALPAIDKRIGLAQRHGNQRMEADAWGQKARAYEEMSLTSEALDALKSSVRISQRPAPYESLHRYLSENASGSVGGNR
jgi:tetratricopeptide (TPR) repeat protein/tRNA A-37 threonylcarbamoyl transferase component Bud32